MISSGISIPSLSVRRRSAGLLAFNPLALFDLTDRSSLSQDLAGNVPVNDVQQDVGHVKDTSGNGHHLSAPSDSARGFYVTGYPNTLSVGTSSAPSAPYDGLTQSHLIQDGAEDADLRGGWFHDSNYFGLMGRQFPSATRNSGNIPAANGHSVSWKASFIVDRDFAIRIDGGDNLLDRYRVTINGVAHKPVNHAGVGPGRRWWAFKLPAKANRVVVEGFGDARWFGFKTRPGASVSASAPGWRTIVFGDSFTAAAGASAPWNGWVNLLRPHEEFSSVASGNGGTGYVNDSSGAERTLADRIVDDFNRISAASGAPDEVVIALGLNDVGQTGVEAGANAAFNALRSVYSGPVWVIGPWDHHAPNTPPAAWSQTRDSILSATQARPGFTFVDMEGFAFTKADSTHPDDAGHKAIAEHLLPRLADTDAIPVVPQISNSKGRVMGNGSALFQAATRFGLGENPGLTVVAALNTGPALSALERIWHLGDVGAGSLSGGVDDDGIVWNHSDGGSRFGTISNGTNVVIAWRRPAGGSYGDSDVFLNGAAQPRTMIDNPALLPADATPLFHLFGGVGGLEPFAGEIAALGIFDALSDTDLTAVMTQFAGRYLPTVSN